MDVLLSFRPGWTVQGNAEIAERTGLSRATVSRLAQTLVRKGLLQVEPRSRQYRLSPAVLGLAFAMRSGSALLQAAQPPMQELAHKLGVNVGLASADGLDMVYLESVRHNRRAALRQVLSGQRIPMELTSLGRAHLADLSDRERKPLLAGFRARRASHWAALSAEIEAAMASVDSQGYCLASWQPGVVALATPLRWAHERYALNLSLSGVERLAASERRSLARHLLALKQRIVQAAP